MYGWRECKLRYRSYKLVVKGETMQFDCTSSKNGQRCKRLRECMKIKNNFKWYKQCQVSLGYLISSEIPNGHIHLGHEQVVFGLAHTS
jgi:hypothetical protein